jgi:hypothetical protein
MQSGPPTFAPGYRWRVDRNAIARAQRRRQASDALAFERERAASLEEQIGEIVAELEGPRIDEETFARMAPEDSALARSLLRPGESDAPADEWLIFGDDAPEEEQGDPRAEAEQEIARLQEEIAASRRRREALERYLEALGG